MALIYNKDRRRYRLPIKEVPNVKINLFFTKARTLECVMSGLIRYYVNASISVENLLQG